MKHTSMLLAAATLFLTCAAAHAQVPIMVDKVMGNEAFYYAKVHGVVEGKTRYWLLLCDREFEGCSELTAGQGYTMRLMRQNEPGAYPQPPDGGEHEISIYVKGTYESCIYLMIERKTYNAWATNWMATN